MTTRQRQLSAAKRRQRLKDRPAGQVFYQLKHPAALRDRLKDGIRSAGFVARLHGFLHHEIIRVDLSVGGRRKPGHGSRVLRHRS